LALKLIETRESEVREGGTREGKEGRSEGSRRDFKEQVPGRMATAVHLRLNVVWFRKCCTPFL
jgi:hypothetical protein